MANKVMKFLQQVFLRGNPPMIGPSTPTREREPIGQRIGPPHQGPPSIETSEVTEPRDIPNIPVENFGPSRTFSDDWMPKVTRDPSHPVDHSSIELPRVSEDGTHGSEWWEPSARQTPRSFPPVEPPSLDNMADSYNLAEYWGPPPPSDGGGFGPPRDGSGGTPPPSSDPEPKPPNNRFFFLLAGFSISYAIFLWFQEELQKETENQLGELEQAHLLAKTEVKPKEGLALAALRQVQGFGRGGLLLLGGLVSGRDTFIRAFHLIALRPLRQVARALVPSFLRALLGPFFGIIARLSIVALPAISRILCFFISLDFLKRLLLIFVNPEWVEPLVPFLDSIVYTMQGFFATPRGVSVAASFLEKNVKVLSCTLLFGGICSNFLLFFQEDDQRVQSLIYCSLFGISVYIILNDHKFVGIFVQNLIQTFPSIQPFAQSPSGQACLLFGSSLFVQQTVGFSQIVTFFYAWLLYSSGLYSYILKANLPFRPPK